MLQKFLLRFARVIIYKIVFLHIKRLGGVDSRGAGGARAPSEFGGSEKRTEREIDSINKSTPEFEKLKNPKRLISRVKQY